MNLKEIEQRINIRDWQELKVTVGNQKQPSAFLSKASEIINETMFSIAASMAKCQRARGEKVIKQPHLVSYKVD